MKIFKRTIYERSPIWLQDYICNLYSHKANRERFGPGFHRKLDFLHQSDNWSLNEMRNYQDEQLRCVIRSAYDSVPFYHSIMKERGLTPDDIRSHVDLYKFPILTKNAVREQRDLMISTAFKSHELIHGYTSGTTGTSLHVAATKDAIEFQWACAWRHLNWLGLKLGDTHITFGGSTIVPISQQRPPYWRKQKSKNRLYFSIYHLTSETIKSYVEAFEEFRPTYINGYPSAIYLFATLMEHQGIQLRYRPRWVITGSESLLEWQRTKIHEYIARTSDFYAQAERCGILSRCPENDLLHENLEFGIIEPMAVVGADKGSLKRMVCTGLTNLAMPFIRYDVGDLIACASGQCRCGRMSPTAVALDGRTDSFVVTPDGKAVGRFSPLFKEFPAIVESQIVQDDINRIVVKIVRGDKYSIADEQRLLKGLQSRLGNMIEIEFQYVNHIPRSVYGKFRSIVSTVGPRFLRQNDILATQKNQLTGRSKPTSINEHGE